MDSVRWTRRKLLSRTSMIAACALAPQKLFALNSGPAAKATPATPFSRFTDIAATSGLIRPSIYGETDHATYLLENLGGGCAFFATVRTIGSMRESEINAQTLTADCT